MKNFTVGRDIVAILNSSEEIRTSLGDKIFPLVAVANTTFPFLVYRRSYYTPQSNKDYENEKVGMEIVICSTTYNESVGIADAVADAILHQETDTIDDIKITNINEDFIDDTYTQKINLEITLK